MIGCESTISSPRRWSEKSVSMSVRSMPSVSFASPRSASSSWILPASVSGTPVERGIAPRIDVTPARQLVSGSHGAYSW